MKRQTYTPEIKERAVRMLIEAANDYPSTWSATNPALRHDKR